LSEVLKLELKNLKVESEVINASVRLIFFFWLILF
jgi:hypothetical protein